MGEEEEDTREDSDLLSDPFLSFPTRGDGGDGGDGGFGSLTLFSIFSSVGATTGSEEQDRLVNARIFGGEGLKSTNSSAYSICCVFK